MAHVGIDVGGAPRKGYALCLLEWSCGRPFRLAFASRPHEIRLPDVARMRPLVAGGDTSALAALTYPSARAIARGLWQSITRLTARPAGVFIDAPSAFARNSCAHGRLTDKAGLRALGVTAQSPPSLCLGSPHGGDWQWMVYGIVAFAACIHRGNLTAARWREALAEGTHRQACKLAEPVLRECFPTATVAVLREHGGARQVRRLLRGLLRSPYRLEVRAVIHYLARGVRKRHQLLYDRADALVAALSALPYVRRDFVEQAMWPTRPVRWCAAGPGAHLTEGVISCVRPYASAMKG